MKLTRDKIQRMIGSAGYGSSAGSSGGGGGDIIGYATQTWVKSLRWWGATFDPQATDPDNVTGALTGVTNITASGNISAGGNLTVTGNITSSGTITGDTLAATTAMTLGGKAVATQEWTGQNYVSIAFFSRLFQAYNGSTAVNPNDLTTTIDNIKAMFGFWTDQYLTALGKNPNVQPSSLYLSQLADVSIPSPTDGQVLTYSSSVGKWIASNASSGTDMATVWANLAAADSSKQIDISHLTTALSGYLPLTGGTLTGTLTTAKIHSNANSSTDLTHIPSDSEIALETGDDSGNISAWIWREQFSKSNWGIFHDNSSDILHFVGNSISRFSINLIYGDVKVGTNNVIHSGNIASQTVANATNCLLLTGGTLTGTLTTAKIHSNANSSTDLTHIPSDSEIALETGDDSGNISAWIWREQFSKSNWGIFHDNSSDILHFVGNSISRFSINLIYGDVKVGTNNVIHSGNIASQSVSYATSAGDAATLGGTAKDGLFTDFSNITTGADAGKVGITIGCTTRALAVDAATLGGTAKGDLFSALSSDWTTNLSITIGGTTRSLPSLYADYANQLRYTRTLWGQNFNGTANVSGSMTDVGNITMQTGDHSILTTNGNLILGYSNNEWVKVMDICSYTDSNNWNIHQNGNANFANVYSAGYVTALSDIRFKNVIRHFALDADTIANASIIQFRWKDGTDKATHVGGIAQEWQAFLPEAVHETKDGRLSMDYGVIAYTSAVSLAKKVVAQQQEIDDLKQRLERLERLLSERKDAETQRKSL